MVRGLTDDVTDGNIQYFAMLGASISTDPKYSGLTQSVALINMNIDVAAYLIQMINNRSSEDGTAASFTVTLMSIPTADLLVPIATTNNKEGQLAISSLTFTP